MWVALDLHNDETRPNAVARRRVPVIRVRYWGAT
jgi:hypothetical protein